MNKVEVLNNIAHENLKVNDKYSSELGDGITSTLAFMTEFAEIQKEYPILCRKDPETGEYQAVVFFGLHKDENLYLTEADPDNQKHVGWRAEYVPAAMSRGPFSIGLQRNTENGEESQSAVVHIDMEHPKANCADGQQVFLQNGGQSPYLNYITSALNTINDGIPLTKAMFAAFSKYELLEPVTLDIEFLDKSKLTINQFETINAEKLSSLSGEVLAEFNRAGFLQAAYFIVTSMSNIRKLIDWKNRRLMATGDAH